MSHENNSPTPFAAETFAVQQFLEQAADIVLLLTADGQLVHVNENGRMLLSLWDEEELASLTIADLVVEEERPLQLETAIPAAIQDGSWQGEFTFLSRDGLEIPVAQRIIGNVVEGQAQTPLLAILARDITERKWVETSLLESETRFRSSFENTSLGISLVSAEGHFLQVNQPLCDILAYTETEFLAHNLKDLLHSDDLAEGQSFLQRLGSGEVNTINRELRFIHKNGHTLWA
ncbi:MAG: PAS domain S-box protein, partial [Anaerolineales bacterium]|nr:PAS domain S-box protein [Anaerolineales bacterium]